jgi:hypothetical protein
MTNSIKFEPLIYETNVSIQNSTLTTPERALVTDGEGCFWLDLSKCREADAFKDAPDTAVFKIKMRVEQSYNWELKCLKKFSYLQEIIGIQVIKPAEIDDTDIIVKRWTSR